MLSQITKIVKLCHPWWCAFSWENHGQPAIASGILAFMFIADKLVAVLLSVAVASANPPQPLASATVSFPAIGTVSISALAKPGDFPRLVFSSKQTGRTLLDAQVGRENDWRGILNYPGETDIRFVVLHRPGLPDPLIVALAKRELASDCAFNSAVFGNVEGQLSELTPALPDHFLRGGIFLSPAAGGKPAMLTVTSERYQAKDVHYTGPSRMTVFIYTYDSSQGKFIETRKSEANTDSLKVLGENLIELFGEFPNC
jgi:hypothetical protein